MKKIAKVVDGKVHITTMAANVEKAFEFADVSRDEIHALIQSKGHLLVEDADIPQDRTFRNAWTVAGGKIDVDMDKAREIHKAEIMKARDRVDQDYAHVETRLSATVVALSAKMEKTDTPKLREERDKALADLEKVQKERERLAALDDIDLSAAKTPDELKAIRPV